MSITENKILISSCFSSYSSCPRRWLRLQMSALHPFPLRSSRLRFLGPVELLGSPILQLPAIPQLSVFLVQRAFPPQVGQLTFLTIAVQPAHFQYEYDQPRQPLLSYVPPIPILIFQPKRIQQRCALLPQVLISQPLQSPLRFLIFPPLAYQLIHVQEFLRVQFLPPLV